MREARAKQEAKAAAAACRIPCRLKPTVPCGGDDGSKIATGRSSIAAKDWLVAGAWRCFIVMIGLALASMPKQPNGTLGQEAVCAIGHRSRS